MDNMPDKIEIRDVVIKCVETPMMRLLQGKIIQLETALDLLIKDQGKWKSRREYLMWCIAAGVVDA